MNETVDQAPEQPAGDAVRSGRGARLVYALTNMIILCTLAGLALTVMPTSITRWAIGGLAVVLLVVAVAIKKDLGL